MRARERVRESKSEREDARLHEMGTRKKKIARARQSE